MIPFDMKLKLLDWITFILFAQENLAMLLTFSSSMMGAVAILGLMWLHAPPPRTAVCTSRPHSTKPGGTMPPGRIKQRYIVDVLYNHDR